MKIKNSIALVTGANRGIGKAYVEALIKWGAKKVYAAMRDVETFKKSHPECLGKFEDRILNVDDEDTHSPRFIVLSEGTAEIYNGQAGEL